MSRLANHLKRLLAGIESRTGLDLADSFLFLRAVFFVGRRYECPCCGWRVRQFVAAGGSMKAREKGHCPRCNSKARHRRDWLFLQQRADLLGGQDLRLLHLSPRRCIERRLRSKRNIQYVASDIEKHPLVDVIFDLASAPFTSETFDALVCIHVLEHVENDREAMSEMYRVLRSGGWALITVPLRLGSLTYEDPGVVDPEERRLAFGETSHVRWYGSDVVDRIEAAGFTVDLDLAEDLSDEVVDRYGLLRDENVLFCTKP